MYFGVLLNKFTLLNLLRQKNRKKTKFGGYVPGDLKRTQFFWGGFWGVRGAPIHFFLCP